MINKVIILGNLGQDPKTNIISENAQVSSFSVATSESYKDKQTNERKTVTEWHNVVVWNALSKIVDQYLKKGSQVYIEGKLVTRKYQDKNGNERWTTEIVARTMKMLGSKNEGRPFPNATDAPVAANTAAPVAATNEETPPPPPRDDLPF